jgi:hypothetical protein
MLSDSMAAISKIFSKTTWMMDLLLGSNVPYKMSVC